MGSSVQIKVRKKKSLKKMNNKSKIRIQISISPHKQKCLLSTDSIQIESGRYHEKTNKEELEKIITSTISRTKWYD